MRNYALLVACRRLYQRELHRMNVEEMHRADVDTHHREMNAVEMVLSMEQRKSQRLEGLMGEAARQYEQDMSALQQKQKWGKKQGGRQGGRQGRGQDVHVQLNAEGRYVNTAGGGGAVARAEWTGAHGAGQTGR